MSATPPTYDVYPRVPCSTPWLPSGKARCLDSLGTVHPCPGCRGDGTRSDLDNGTPVEPSHLYDYERRFVACFVPVSSTEENPT